VDSALRGQTGNSVTVRRIQENLEDDYETLSFLGAKGVIPGAELLVVETLLFNETISVQIKGRDVTLGLKSASEIYVGGVLLSGVGMK
jgi:Fe2+ transport system protein FeoA